MNTKAVLHTLAVAFAAVLVGQTLSWIPLLLALPALLAYLAVRFGYGYSAISLALCAAVIYALDGYETAILLVLLVLPPALAISYLHGRMKASFHALAFACGAVMVGPVLIIALVYAITGKDVVTAVTSWAQAVFAASTPGTDAYAAMVMLGYFDSVYDLFANMTLQPFQDALLGKTALDMAVMAERAANALRIIIADTAPSALVLYSLSGGLIGFTGSRGLLLRGGVSMAKMPAFSDWELPRSFGYGSLITLLGLYLGGAIGFNGFEYAFSIALMLFALVYSIQGLALFAFLLKKLGLSGFTLALLSVIAGVLLFAVMAALGFVEQLVRFRRRVNKAAQ